MKIYFFNEDTHLPRKISKCINSHLITRRANEKPLLTKLKTSQSVMILVVRLGQLTDMIVVLLIVINNGFYCRKLSSESAFHCKNSCNRQPTIAIQTANSTRRPVLIFWRHYNSHLPLIRWQIRATKHAMERRGINYQRTVTSNSNITIVVSLVKVYCHFRHHCLYIMYWQKEKWRPNTSRLLVLMFDLVLLHAGIRNTHDIRVIGN
jgi:hypothetical protein